MVARCIFTASTILSAFASLNSTTAGFSCDDDFACLQIQANGMTFNCRSTGLGDKQVLLLHGFPEWSDMFVPLMRELARVGFHSVACDQRGYSESARPEGKDAYHYDTLRSDIFAVADRIGFGKFHLVGHDHGAVLGWYAASSDMGRDRLLSYTALSIPHLDAFAKSLWGPEADINQQVASQYFTMFVEPDSSTKNLNLFCNTLGWAPPHPFPDCSSFQKALYWYNGAVDAGVMALPPLMSASALAKYNIAMATLRGSWGGTPNDGVGQMNPIGQIQTPALYVCGTEDPMIMCNTAIAKSTEQYCDGGYTYLEVTCGHTIVESGFLGCMDSRETQKVLDGIVNHISQYSSRVTAV